MNQDQEIFKIIAEFIGLDPKSEQFNQFVQQQIYMSKVAEHIEENKKTTNPELIKIMQKYTQFIQEKIELNMERVIKNLDPSQQKSLQDDLEKLLLEK